MWPGPWACLSLLGLGAIAGASAVLWLQRWQAPVSAAAPTQAARPAVLTGSASARADLSQEARAQLAEVAARRAATHLG